MSPTTPSESAEPIRTIAILGTGLIGASTGLALRAHGFPGAILGWDPDPHALAEAASRGAVTPAPSSPAAPTPALGPAARPASPGKPDTGGAGESPAFPRAALAAVQSADIILLAGPVLTIARWLESLAPILTPAQLVTDVGSVKGFLVERAHALYNAPGQPGWLPGHPMAGKEHSGAAHAEPGLFADAAWLFTTAIPSPHGASSDASAQLPTHPLAAEWIRWARRIGAHPIPLTAERHDTLCAAISHLPQMLATALAAMLGEALAPELDNRTLQQIGGRALREMTRLAASPYSMWRDIALTNQPAVSAALLALEQQLTHLREHLKSPELRTLFAEANTFRTTLTRDWQQRGDNPGGG